MTDRVRKRDAERLFCLRETFQTHSLAIIAAWCDAWSEMDDEICATMTTTMHVKKDTSKYGSLSQKYWKAVTDFFLYGKYSFTSPHKKNKTIWLDGWQSKTVGRNFSCKRRFFLEGDNRPTDRTVECYQFYLKSSLVMGEWKQPFLSEWRGNGRRRIAAQQTGRRIKWPAFDGHFTRRISGAFFHS